MENVATAFESEPAAWTDHFAIARNADSGITREREEMAAAGIAGAELRFLSMHGFSGKPGPWFDPEG
jgi:hypothetical protein